MFAKKKKKNLDQGRDSLYSQVFPRYFHFMRGHSLVELTEHDNSAADTMVQWGGRYSAGTCPEFFMALYRPPHCSMNIIYVTAAFIVHYAYRYRCSHTYMHNIQQ